MYVLETNPQGGCIKHMHCKIHIETYVLETDPYRGCIEHIRKEKKSIKVYMLKTDSKRRLYTACKGLIVS